MVVPQARAPTGAESQEMRENPGAGLDGRNTPTGSRITSKSPRKTGRFQKAVQIPVQNCVN